MPAIVFLMMLIAILGLTDTSSRDRFQRDREDGAAIATQMAFYHGKALERCAYAMAPAVSEYGTAACNGIVAVNTTSVNPNPRFDYASRFRSATNGDWIITAFLNDASTKNTDPRHQWGLISSGLREVTRNSVAAGPYQATTGRINNGTSYYVVVGGVAQAGATHVQVPPTFVSWLGLVDGSPVIATRAQ